MSCETHCCKLHGCKYGYDCHEGYSCSVVNGTAQQEHLCERCYNDGIQNLEELETHVQLERAGNELKINALHLGLGKLMRMCPDDKDVDLMRKYLERIVDDLKRG